MITETIISTKIWILLRLWERSTSICRTLIQWIWMRHCCKRLLTRLGLYWFELIKFVSYGNNRSFAARLKSRIEKYGIPNSPELLNVDKKWKNVQLYTHLLLLGENIRRSVDANHHKEATLWPQKCLDQNVPCLQEFMNNCAKNKI